MLGLTTLGIVHTAISLVAAWVTAVTSLGIFQHGGFGPRSGVSTP